MSRFGRVGVLMGGVSSEREISLRSGHAVLKALQHAGVDAVAVDLQRDWSRNIEQAGIHSAFNLLHGTLGEDGCVQGMLEVMGIPYTGSGVMASALCMNKLLSKQLLSSAGIKVPLDIAINENGPLRYPVFLKPVSEGSSIGLHLLESKAQWLELNIHGSESWMAEMPVNGVEIAVSVLDGRALPPVEVSPKSGVYDYTSKYTAGATEYFCPARLPAETVRYCMQRAEEAVAALHCKGAPRVDMIVDGGGEPLVLEINTLPGMTETSLLPKSAAAAGISFEDLCLRILATASLENGGLMGGGR
ncbi:D-alanine--D-alanine ligase [Mariprofundus ferrinatatus]|uniref:D-alanine--D-alanine ligase n=1 Tax=Mariprofundus ferrinatatus TaxID=1921087 RepID=A0A2K8L5T3_9PROT|nr:D-alanine--D-alanine ligase [Mariprofundus ferrinatatus]ATX82685.1 D-alanine--D-alanine ligase [Mariprofundus ferrinatatus]